MFTILLLQCLLVWLWYSLHFILVESSLSFLGIGVPMQVVTWGSLLNLGRGNIEAWWLILFPGIAIFFTITIYNMIAGHQETAFRSKIKKLRIKFQKIL